MLRLKTYRKYVQTLEGAADDAPLGIYDSQFALDERSAILQEYSVPSYFNSDLFELLPKEDRPPSQWILMGPARSGTGLHVDPLGTHAWVTLMEGCKRWVLFPPGVDRESIGMQEPQLSSVKWFQDCYPSAVEQYPDCVEVLQRQGEMVYVPAGWPHVVLNLDQSVALTHNYASEYPSTQRLWKAVVEEEPDLAPRFLTALQEHRAELAREILALSTEPDWSPEEKKESHDDFECP
jgi:histone arginine demethylase JMJD6